MQKQNLVALLLGLALALVLVLGLVGVLGLSWDGHGAAPKADPGALGEAKELVGSRSGARSIRPEVPRQGEVQQAEADAGRPARKEVRDLDRLRIVVVDGKTRSPIPGAEVLLMRESPDVGAMTREQHAAWRRARQEDRVAFLRAHGEILRCGADGSVVTDRPADFARFYGVEEERVGVGDFDPQGNYPDGLRIRLEDGVHVDVRVRTHEGRPIPDFQMDYVLYLENRQPRARPRPHFSRRKSTNSAGTARIRHLHHEIQGLTTATQAVAHLEVSAPFVGGTVRQEIAGADLVPGTRQTTLTLPPLGAVKVVLRDAGGARLAAPWEVTLQLGGNRHRRMSADGLAHWPHVALGRQLEVTARIGGQELVKKVAGPAKAGEVVVVELGLAASVARVTGRLMAGDRPIQRPFELVMIVDGELRKRTMTSRPDGQFSFPLADELLGKRLTQVRAWALGFDRRRDGREALAVVDRTIRAGAIALGDLQCRLPPRIVAGQVMANGRPASRSCTLQVESWAAASGRWRRHREIEVKMRKGGAFAAYGRLPGERYRLAVNSFLYQPRAPVPFELGQGDLRVELAPAGSMKAKVLLGHRVPIACLQMRAGPSVGEPQPELGERKGGMLFDQSGTDRTYMWTGLPPGHYDVAVRLVGVPQPIALIERVRVAPGRHAQDPRLERIDIRSMVEVTRLQVQGADGSRIARGVVLVASSDPDQTPAGHPLRRGRATLLTRAGAMLRVLVPGFREAQVPVGGTRAVKLTPVRRVGVKLELADPRALVGRTLLVRCVPRQTVSTRPIRVHSGWSHTEARLGDYQGAVPREVRLGGEGRGVVELRPDLEYELQLAWLDKGKRAPLAWPGAPRVRASELRGRPVLLNVDPRALRPWK